MTAHVETGHEAHHDHGHAPDAPSHGTQKSYLIGFGLSVVLTAIPFWLVMTMPIGNTRVTGFIVMAFALVQIIVHMIYFLHMDTKSEGGWTVMALIFTVVIIGIALSGSLWVMFHLTTNMMPLSPDAMKQMP